VSEIWGKATLMFYKKDIEKVSGYIHMPHFEDYYLWMRMLHVGYKISNINGVLMFARISDDMMGRRSGWKYAHCEYDLLKQIKSLQYISTFQFYFLLFTHVHLRLLPQNVLSYLINIFMVIIPTTCNKYIRSFNGVMFGILIFLNLNL
jgi:amylovoran biosynthesis glycosyltransferase AmsE